MKLAFVTANYVGRASNYSLKPFNWAVAEQITKDRWSLTEWEAILDDILRAGFKLVEVWTAHAPYDRLTLDQVKQMRKAMDRRGVKAVAYSGWFGGASKDPYGLEKKFQVAQTLGAPLLVGGCDTESIPIIYELCKKYKVKFAVENHPEKSPQEILDKIRTFSDWIGAAPDTGWWATHGCDPVYAVEKLGKYILHVHLKDIKKVGEHETCQFGKGIVDIPGVVKALKKIGYEGVISIEHEPGNYDPTEEVILSRKFIEAMIN